MIDPESEFRDALRPIRIRSEAEVKADARRERREHIKDTLFVVLASVAIVALLLFIHATTPSVAGMP